MRRIIGLIHIFVVLFVPAVGSAAEGANSEESALGAGTTFRHPGASAAAEALFQRGREAMSEGHYDEACAAFEESLRLERAVGAVMNLAVCEEKRGHLARAWECWERAVRMLSNTDPRWKFAEGRRDKLKEQVPRLAIYLEKDAPDGISVVRDGILLEKASWGVPLPVDPGSHRIVVSAPGREPRVYQRELTVGKVDNIVVAVGPPVQASRGVRVRRHVGIASTSAGALGVAGGIISGVMVQKQQNIVSAHCDDELECDEKGLRAAKRGKALLIGNAISWSLGAAGLAAGTILLFTLPREHGQTMGGLDLSFNRVGMKVSGTF